MERKRVPASLAAEPAAVIILGALGMIRTEGRNQCA